MRAQFIEHILLLLIVPDRREIVKSNASNAVLQINDVRSPRRDY